MQTGNPAAINYGSDNIHYSSPQPQAVLSSALFQQLIKTCYTLNTYTTSGSLPYHVHFKTDVDHS